MTHNELLAEVERLREQVRLLTANPPSFPFITYDEQESFYHRFLKEYAGLTGKQIKKHQEEDNEYLVYELTYEGLKEIFYAGFEAAEERYKKEQL